jgi:hypothetical protein
MDASVLFNIDKRDVFVDGAKVPHRKAIINKNTGQVIGIVSDNYAPILNKVLLEHCTTILDKAKMPFNVPEGHLIRGGSETVIEIDIPSKQVLADKDDPLMLRIYLINSFDGYSSARLIAGFVRLVCENGMTVGKKEFTFHYRHVANAGDMIVADFNRYVSEKSKAMLAFVTRMTGIIFSDAKQVQEIISKAEWIPNKYHGGLISQAKDMKTLNAWELYNVFTYVITHDIARNIEGRLKFYRKLNIEALKWKIISN